jgi:hypothetical protein
MPLSDTDIQRIVAELQRQSIGNAARLVAEQARTKTGVIAGGPYGLASFDGTGRATWAGYIGCFVWLDSSKSTANDTDETLDTFGSEDYDTSNFFTAGTSTARFVMPLAGYYDVHAHVVFTSNATGRRQAIINHRSAAGSNLGGLTSDQRMAITSASQGTPLDVILQGYYFEAGEQIEVIVRQTSGGSLNVNTASFVSIALRGA